jgi:hypothetical protein
MNARQDNSTGRKISSNAHQDNLPVIQDNLKALKDSSKVFKDNSPGRQDISKARQDRSPASKIRSVVLQDNCNDERKVVLTCFHVLLTRFSCALKGFLPVLNQFPLVLKACLPALKPLAYLLTINRGVLNRSGGTKMCWQALLTDRMPRRNPFIIGNTIKVLQRTLTFVPGMKKESLQPSCPTVPTSR